MLVCQQASDEFFEVGMAVKIPRQEKRRFDALPRQHLTNVGATVGKRIAGEHQRDFLFSEASASNCALIVNKKCAWLLRIQCRNEDTQNKNP